MLPLYGTFIELSTYWVFSKCLLSDTGSENRRMREGISTSKKK